MLLIFQKYEKELIFGLAMWLVAINLAHMTFWIEQKQHLVAIFFFSAIGAENLAFIAFLLWYAYKVGILSTLKMFGLSLIVFILLNIFVNTFVPHDTVLLLSIMGLVAIPVLLNALIRIVRFPNSNSNSNSN